MLIGLASVFALARPRLAAHASRRLVRMASSSTASTPTYARVDGLSQHWNPIRARVLKHTHTLQVARGDTPSTPADGDARCVVYWMSRDQRAVDNWALLHAQQLACAERVPLRVAFCLLPGFLGAPVRHFGFMLRGLAEVEAELHAHGIPFHLLRGQPEEVLPAFAKAHGASTLVCDYSPLRIARGWKQAVCAQVPDGTSVIEVDAHNVVPVWHASDKQEVGARTLRPKIERLLPIFLTEFPKLQQHPHKPTKEKMASTDWESVLSGLGCDRNVAEVDWVKPGERAAHLHLEGFVKERLRLFGAKRNDPNIEALSDLSPYLHYGQLAPQRAALYVRGARAHSDSVKSFIEEAVVRRELADNFCHYNQNYDSLDGAAGWARDSLLLHASDPRDYVYSSDQLEKSQTHDDLWNAAQIQMVNTGKMHGFMRMYWAKKILEWTSSPSEALRIGNYLNDRFSLDGRDPNGYVGVAWSIMGIHDMGWAERTVFGKIRYMNYAGCKRKFDIAEYVAKWGGTKETKGGKGPVGAGSLLVGKRPAAEADGKAAATVRKSKK